MSLSFEDSLKKNNIETSIMKSNNIMMATAMPTVNMNDIAVADSSIMTLDENYGIAAYSGDDGNWQEHSGYVRYNYFSDDNISIINNEKNISLNEKQINITQEENSQYIPFEMPRYYDGYDLTSTIISIHYETKNGRHGASKPVNVTYNDEKIRFGWLVDAGATVDAGTLEFEIHAYGSIAGSDGISKSYTWKTKRNKDINVLQSLCDCNDVINNIDDSWMQELITDIAEKVADEIKNVAVGEQVAAAERAATDAEGFANTAKQYAETASSVATETVNLALKNYATTKYVDDAVASVDVSDQLTSYVQTSNLEENYYNKTDTAQLINDTIEEKGFATEDYVGEAIASADIDNKLTAYAKTEYVNALVGNIGESKDVIDYVDDAVKSVDVSDQLTNYVQTSDLENNYYDKINTAKLVDDTIAEKGFATEDYVGEAIEQADITGKLDNYYKKEETYSKHEVDTALGNVTVDLTGYATETYVNNKTDALSSRIDINTGNISSLSTTVGNLQNAIGSIDTSPNLHYRATYEEVEAEDGSKSNIFTLWEAEESFDPSDENDNTERTAVSQFHIVGGGGGVSSGSVLKIGYITTSPLVVTTNDKAIIKYTFSGTDSSGDAVTEGNATWKIAGRVIATNIASGVTKDEEGNVIDEKGENTFDITDYLSVGTQKVNLTITDDAGSLVSKNWTVQKIDFKIESPFNDKLTYPIGVVPFDYTPYGAIPKDVHFILDGKEIGKINTSSSGIPMGYEIPEQEHGSHLLEAYMTATVNGNAIKSNSIVKDIIWYDETSSVPVIGTIYQDFTARQYDATNIEYTVYDPTTEAPTVEIAVDGVVVSNPILDKATNIYSFKTDVVGKHIITITCGETVKTLIANITKLDINISPVTAGLAFDFNPSGKSNNDVDRIWTNGTVSMSVSDNFDWINGGYQYDENGDQYFCIKAGTSAEIDYELFADDAKKNGKEFKLVFKTTNVAKPNATFLSCIDNTTDSDHIGIKMDVHEAFIYGQAGNLHLPYSEEDIIEFEFNISKDTEAIPMVMGYEDGVSTCPMVYEDSHNFTQNSPKIISLGSEDCDLHIYRFKVYNTSLTDRGILNNFIADARNAEEMISRYDRNQIYDENQNLNPDVLAEKCPWLRIIKIEAPHFTNGKKYPVNNTTIEYIYKNGDPILDNWKAVDAVHVGQGTSSDNYGASGRNMDLVLKSHKDFNNSPVITLSDGTVVDKVSLTRDSVPANYFNIKVNIASSENANNALLQKRYNAYNPYNRAFVREEGYDTSMIKDTMEFHNCVVFIKETDTDLSTHTEFADNDWHFYSIGNIGDSKKTDNTRLTDQNDEYECIVELMDVQLPLSDFPVDTMINAMGYTVDEKTKEKIYTWATNDNLGILYELIDGEYVLTQDEAIDLTKTYYVDILEHDDFSEDYTYGWRYISDEDNEDVVNYCHQKWIDFYRFVTTSTDEEFKSGLGDYFVLDSALYYYLFTTRYTMVDNRAKNSFWHYGKTGELDTNGNPIRKWDLSFDYDNDTSLGINNYGDMVYRYGLEDTHVDENGVEIFRESDSTFFCRLRDLFNNELKAMYNTLESQNAWHGEGLIAQFDEWQSEFPEELWRVDIERKYIRTYNSSHINGKGDSQFLVDMAHGKKKYQRRQYERNQEKYMASKYQSSVAASDENSIIIRCGSIPDGNLVVKPNYSLTLTPYSYMYLNVEYANGVIQVPVEEIGVPVTVPFSGDSTDIIKIYSASSIQSVGDLSPCYARTINTSSASKLKELIIGNETEGYDNPYLTTLTTGANYLLEKLNIENVSGLTNPLNLIVLNNLKELYAHGSNIGGVTFADGGRIEIAELPAINAISMKNLIYLTNLNIADFSNLTTLTVENCNTVDLLSILDKANNINRVRIVGIDWTLEDTSLLERLYTLKGIDKNGYNADQSVLTGKVYVPLIRQQQLHEYQTAWSDLEITYKTRINQYPVTFVNYDGTELYVQYVDEGDYAVDPEENGDIQTPIRSSSISTDFTYAGWDKDLSKLQIFEPETITATYAESIRKYGIQYMSMGEPVKGYETPVIGNYGDNMLYEGNIPTYTLEEGGYKYYLFKGWDKSGFLLEGEDGKDFNENGVKIVNAIYDEFKYTSGVFDGKQLKELSPVQVYALTKLTEPVDKELSDYGMNVETGDEYSFEMGYDVDYKDIKSELIISNKMCILDGAYKDTSAVFTGNNYIDTGIKLFDTDKDFVLAIDYKMLENTSGATLMQCYQIAGNNGFKLNYETSPQFTWGGTTITNNNGYTVSPSKVDCREMLVIRHKKGENNLYVYTSNLNSTDTTLNHTDIGMYVIKRDITTQSDNAPLVFGAARQDSGRFVNYGVGEISWCKIWYKDLGEEVCKQLASWTHEKIALETSGFYRYQLHDDTTKESMMSLLATHLLSIKKKYYDTNINNGGWANSHLNSFLNTKFYNAIPYQIRTLIKKVSVTSTIGKTSSDVSSSGCFITIPALYDVYDNLTQIVSGVDANAYRKEVYDPNGTINFFTGLTDEEENTNRKRAFDGGDYNDYWLRTMNVGFEKYAMRVNSSGNVEQITSVNGEYGILIEISF